MWCSSAKKGNTFYNPISGSYSFPGSVSLGCDFYKCFSAFLFTILSETRGLEWLELSICLPRNQLDSGKQLSWRKGFVKVHREL